MTHVIGKGAAIRATVLAALLGMGAAGGAAAEVLAAPNGMTLYTFDKDAGGMSACYDACAERWPPYLAETGAMPEPGWTLVERTDGKKQWARDGKPVYFYANDKKAGDTTGDGVGGAWHVIMK